MRLTKWFWGLALGGVAIWLWRSAQAREAASQALDTARTALSNNESLSPVREAVSKASDALKPVTDQVKDAVSKAADAVQPAVNQVKDAASKAADAVQPAVDQVKDAVTPAVNQVKDAASKVADAVQPAVDQAKDAASEAGEQVKDAASKAADAVQPAVDQAKDAASEAGEQVKDAASKAADAVQPAVDQAKDAASEAVDQAKDAASKAADAVQPAVDQAKDAASEAGEQVKDAASKAADAVQPAVDQAKDAASEAGEQVKDAASKAADANDLAPHDEDIAGVLDLDGQNLTITQRVLSNIGHEATLHGVPHMNVNTEEGGVVFLRGIVFSQEQREFAELVAATTEGVQSVVNELSIEPGASAGQQPVAASQPAAPSRSTGSQEPDDEDVAGVLDLDGENLTITQRVLSHFGHESLLSGTEHINVNTQERGVVYLRGVVATEEQSRVAQEIAAKTEGVQSVVNELNVE